MDWSKAKTILIIVLLAFCLVLTGMLVVRDVKISKELSENKKAALAYLDELGVKLETELPTKRVKLPVLFVEYKGEGAEPTELTYKKYTVYTKNISSAGYKMTSAGERAAEIMPASSAVLEAVSRMESPKLVINDIELCYYIDNDSINVSSGSSDTAFPAWMVNTSAGTCFVLAY